MVLFNRMKNCLTCGKEYCRPKKQGFKWFEKSKYCSQDCAKKSLIGKKKPARSDEWKNNLSKSLKGRKVWNKDKKCPTISEGLRNSTYQRQGLVGENNPMFGKIGELNPAWKGGITPINLKIRNSGKYAVWRESVFIRDDYTCQSCNSKNVKLNAHHIQRFSTHPLLRLSITNGITLCEKCHRDIKNRESSLVPKFTKINMFKHISFI